MIQVHQCIERCHTPLAAAQGLVTTELEKFQVRNSHHLSVCQITWRNFETTFNVHLNITREQWIQSIEIQSIVSINVVYTNSKI